jgi:2,4-dienoyl-CoA reductase-like NADH-dependent reductase (Old Yellow Enzyme family)
MSISKLFTEVKLGPLTLRNRTIRSAAFEGMCPNHNISDDLINYHTSVAAGGIGMTTVAYASINKNGLSFPHQLWLRREIISDLIKLTDSIHQQGALASIQIGHCGNMANMSVTGSRPIAPTGGINLYGPTFPRTMSKEDIAQVISDFKNAVQIVAEGNFDAVELHAGHGYLISQFISPYTNHRNDEYGGSFENRTRFMREVLTAVKDSLPPHMALIVKMNSYDGFKAGISFEEGIETAKMIEACGADAIVVSGGFVSKAPMYVLRGSMPVKIMAHSIKDPIKKFFVSLIGDKLIETVPFEEGYFMKDALKIQNSIQIPVILVGGMNSNEIIQKAFDNGFKMIALARALIINPNFVNDLRNEWVDKSACTICNYCIAKMYSGKAECHFNETNLPENLKQKIAEM